MIHLKYPPVLKLLVYGLEQIIYPIFIVFYIYYNYYIINYGGLK